MSRRLAELAWPPLPGSTEPPVWQGEHFLVGGRPMRVLPYEAAPSHWSPELTELHEAEAGSTHPIDEASRSLAAQSLVCYTRRAHLVAIDVGCSSAFLIDKLRRTEPSLEIMGADFIEPPLHAAAQRLPGVPLLQFDLRKCPLPDGCVDFLTALNVLEHIDEDATALREIWRLLRPGGVVHLEVPAGPHLYDIYDEHLMHHRRYRLRELVEMVRKVGFTLLKATHLGFFLYPAFAFVKRRNRRLLQLPPEEKQRRVAGQIRATSGSVLLRALLQAELALGRVISYPCGIRCVVVGRKP
jgi:SAM-dependent methyltransferase